MVENNKQVRVENWPIFFHQRVQLFYKKATYCDLTLQFEGNFQVKVHRLVMSVCTEYFEKYFQYLQETCSQLNGNVIIMPKNLQAQVLVPIINFMYTGKLEFDASIFDQIYNAAELMKITILLKLLDSQRDTLQKQKLISTSGMTQVPTSQVPPILRNSFSQRLPDANCKTSLSNTVHNQLEAIKSEAYPNELGSLEKEEKLRTEFKVDYIKQEDLDIDDIKEEDTENCNSNEESQTETSQPINEDISKDVLIIEDSNSIPDTTSQATGDTAYNHPQYSGIAINEDKACTSTNNYYDTTNCETSSINFKNRRTRNFCIFCKTFVLGYARHLFRHHSRESEVMKIFSLPISSKERKELFASLRKRGNYLVYDKLPKPMRSGSLQKKLLPCTNCLGFYSTKHLWRHRKKCCKITPSRHAQVDAQNLLVKNCAVSAELRSKVFPRMRPDDISLTAKKDSLICAYASRFLRLNKDSKLVNVVSRKMRELSRLLLEVQENSTDVTDLYSLLRPKNFGAIVEATKIIAKYNEISDTYTIPTYCINVCTSLKQCCDIALHQVCKGEYISSKLQLSSTEHLEELRQLSYFITYDWKTEITSKVYQDLGLSKRTANITLTSLIKDLKMLTEHLVKKGNEAYSKLLHSDNIFAYKTLLQTVYCRIFLLNRQSSEKVQNIFLQTYEQCANDCDNQISHKFPEAEKVILQNFKGFIILAKQRIPILVSNEVLEHIKILITKRKVFYKEKNVYLFGNITSSKPYCGHKMIHRNIVESGAVNLKVITSVDLQKYIATVVHLLSMSEQEEPKVINFMGIECKISNDVNEIGKIAKLLMLMERKPTMSFEGKTLDEIHVDLEENLLSGDKNNEEPVISKAEMIPAERDTTSSYIPSKRRTLIKWTDEQKKVVTEFFQSHIKLKKPPKRKECEFLINKHRDLLKNKDWLKIKVFVQNKYTGKLR